MTAILYLLSCAAMVFGVCLLGVSCIALIMMISVSNKMLAEFGKPLSRFIPAAFLSGLFVLLVGFLIGRIAE